VPTKAATFGRMSKEHMQAPQWERIKRDCWSRSSLRVRRTLATGILPRDRQPAACCWHTMTALKQQEQ